jgi:hypothetical protein
MGSDDFERDVCELNRRFGGKRPDRDVLADEHLRLDLYRIARGGFPAEELVALMLADPDIGMADAALVELIDDVATQQPGAAFGGWSSAVLDAGVERRAFPSKRIHEWRLLISVNELPSDGLADLIAGSDWVQRGAVERTSERSVLEALAEHGRTKRTKSLAGERLRSLRGRGG